MYKESPKAESTKVERTAASVRCDSYRRGQIAASLTGDNLTDFVSNAIDAFSKPILKKHNVKLPAELEIASGV